MTDVCLLAMPYAAVERPSLALGILKRALTDAGIATRVHYANLLFAEEIELANYFFLSNSSPKLLMGEWTFAGSAFDGTEELRRFPLDPEPYLRECGRRGVGAELLWRIRNAVPAFVDRMAARVLADDPRIVGCSSVFQQHCASLALLRRVKELRPDVITLLGGSNCDKSMGRATHESFSWVDYVVSGEADLLLPGLCRAILDHGREVPPDALPDGVYGPALRTQMRSRPAVPRAPIRDLDVVPVPVYEEYFETLHASPVCGQIRPALLFESSRGCWWGETNQCTFCGLASDGMAYRTKSAQRVLSELQGLREEYGLGRFMATDLILSRSYFQTVLPRLAELPEPHAIFFETSANLARPQVKQLAAAGIRSIQPGIESLHDDILVLLKKGTCSWKNVQLLKWCMQYGITVTWSCLARVPGEDLRWYRDMVEWLPLLAHLQPPAGISMVRFDRFSPYQDDPAAHRLRLEPVPAYRHVYPLSADSLAGLANYFDDVTPVPDDVRRAQTAAYGALGASIDRWQRDFYVSREDIVKRTASATRPVLEMREASGRVLIRDTRPCAVASEWTLDGLAAQAYSACDAALTAPMLVRELEHRHGRTTSWTELAPIVEVLLAQKVMVQLKDRYLSLAVELPHPPLHRAEDSPEGLVMLPRRRAPAAARAAVSGEASVAGA
ncbi:MAG: RiPP maturation radical SAM C-methyltransferase [Vicinamibacteria bacterium]